MSAQLTMYMGFARRMFQRNHPLDDIKERLASLIAFLFNYKSNVKLNRYRQSLYVQQLNRLEGYVSQTNPYHCVGKKIDRRF